MALITNSNTASTAWSTSSAKFTVFVEGEALLFSRPAGTSPWFAVGPVIGKRVVDNPIVGDEYKWELTRVGTTVRAEA
jgi:hypothetical protein